MWRNLASLLSWNIKRRWRSGEGSMRRRAPAVSNYDLDARLIAISRETKISPLLDREGGLFATILANRRHASSQACSVQCRRYLQLCPERLGFSIPGATLSIATAGPAPSPRRRRPLRV